MTFDAVEPLAATTYRASWKVDAPGRDTVIGRQSVALVGKDPASAELLRANLVQRVQPLDIGSLVSGYNFQVTSRWRYEFVELDVRAMAKNGALETDWGPFVIAPTEGRLALIEGPRTDPWTTLPHASIYPRELAIPVHRRVVVVALLFANETEVRNTGAPAGSLTLEYADGTSELVPLVIGHQLDTLCGAFARDCLSVALRLDEPWARSDDHLNVLRLNPNPDVMLENVRIGLDIADARIGLIAGTIVAAAPPTPA
jgi:hypothetical protein